MTPIPEVLRQLPQWVTWRYEDDPAHPDKPKKVPYNPWNGRRASSTDPHTWSDYAAATAAAQRRQHAGVGFVFSKDDPFVGIDLDNCIGDDGTLAPWARHIVASLDSYTEVSPSGHGVKIWVIGSLPGNVRTEHIELYDHARYFTVTGEHLSLTPATIRRANGELAELYGQLRPADTTLDAPAPPKVRADNPHAQRWAAEKVQWICDQMRSAKDGTLHNRRLELGKLMGGVVALGLLSADEGEQFLYDARPPASHEAAERKAIRDGIETGLGSPLVLPTFPTEQSIILDDQGIGHCPSCDTPVQRSRYDYPGTSEPGWYCPQCKHPMVWPLEAYDPPDIRSACSVGEVRPPNYTEQDRTRALERGTPTEQRPNKLRHADDLDSLPNQDWLIEGHLPRSVLAQVYGPPGQGKSNLVLDLALTVAQHEPVVYVVAEDELQYKSRKHAWCGFHRMGAGQLYFWLAPVNLLQSDAVDELLDAIAPLNPSLIIFDPLAQCAVGGNLDETADMTVVCNHLNILRRETDATILVVHHTGWNETHERGSSVLRGNCRTIYKLTQSDDGLITFDCEKMNNAPLPDAIHFRMIPRETTLLDADDMPISSVVLIPASRVLMKDAPLGKKQIAVLEALTLATLKEATFSQLRDHTGVSPSSLNNALSRLIERGFVWRDGDKRGATYHITDKGLQYLDDLDLAAKFGGGTEQTPLNWVVKFGRSSVLSEVPNKPNTAAVCESDDHLFGVVRSSSVVVRSSSVSSFGAPPLGGTEQPNEEQEVGMKEVAGIAEGTTTTAIPDHEPPGYKFVKAGSGRGFVVGPDHYCTPTADRREVLAAAWRHALHRE